ncbi:MAG TPA: hypothetical protein VFQ73_17090 [Flavisolibacter sp.]|nr:hypothetical protein [Flavisolibacter sp.]
MSQNSGHNPGEGNGNVRRSAGNSNERNSYEGFEGMNYEQRRPSYSPHQVNNDAKDDRKETSGGKRRDEI